MVLTRIHTRIKVTSRQNNNEQFCWFVIPEVILGAPKYDAPSCIVYVVNELKENGFKVKYTHPNLLFISWKHYIPGYVRSEFIKQTVKNIDGCVRNILNYLIKIGITLKECIKVKLKLF